MHAPRTFGKTCLALTIGNMLLGSAQAATITIDSALDASGSPACTLREAIALINTPPIGPVTGDCVTNTDTTEPFGTNDTIDFDFLAAQNTITLTEGQLTVLEPLRLVGPGQNRLTIDGNNQSRVFEMIADDISISDMTISNGSSTSFGGGIRGRGENLVISNCRITGNVSDSFGGGVSAIYDVKITDSSITYNLGEYGGGIAFGATNVDSKIESTVISNNSSVRSGGGIRLQQVTGVTISNSTISSNTGGVMSGFANGGGIYALNSQEVTIVNTTVSHNSVSNSGGGVSFRGAFGTKRHDILASTIANNSASGFGGGFHSYSDNTATITNSTLSSNTAGANGGGISAGDTNNLTTLTNVTVFGNQSPGIGGIFRPAGEIVGRNNVVANHATADCNSALFDSNPADNWSQDGSCTNETPEGDPKLGPLEDNGGPTLTHIPLPGSGLINTGSGFVCMNPPVSGVDQRGEARGARRSTECFIGAVEGIQDDGSIFVLPFGDGKAVIFEL